MSLQKPKTREFFLVCVPLLLLNVVVFIGYPYWVMNTPAVRYHDANKVMPGLTKAGVIQSLAGSQGLKDDIGVTAMGRNGQLFALIFRPMAKSNRPITIGRAVGSGIE
jgi:hypothetical protein